jgi:hypothetical protein
VETGNGKDVNSARGEEVIGLVAGKRFATPEQQCRGEWGAGGREVFIQRGEAAGPQALDPPRDRKRASAFQEPHAPGR